MPERPERERAEGTLIGFDFGLRRIGVAVGQTATATATPLRTLAAREGAPDWPTVDRLIAEWRPSALVVGLPLREDGEPHPLRRAVAAFRAALAQRYGLPVHATDERYTSTEAEAILRESRQRGARGRTGKGSLDMLSAALLLEQWMTSSPD
jgi:putative Holliday junction resolvase